MILPLNKYIFYNLVCKDSNVKYTYTGSSINFIKRQSKHKERCCRESADYHNLKVYKIIREHGGWKNWEFKIIAEIENLTKQEAKKIEQKNIDNLNDEYKLNMVRACTSPEIKKKEKRERAKIKRDQDKIRKNEAKIKENA